MKKTSSFQNSLIWFGAAVSIAEILTGTYFAPLGFTKGLLAILVGHVIGCAMFFFAGLIGGRTGRSAMGTVELSFGRIGCLFFAALNVLQLVGWTAIMIYDGALATNTVLGIGKWVWCLVIGGLIVVWIAVGIKNLSWINKIAMAALFILSIVLCVVVFRGGTPVTAPDDSLSFGAAVELAVAMPLSWLPIISDYTRTAEKPGLATAASCSAYFIASSWMFLIGMGAALFTGQDDIAAIMVQAGMGVAGILVVLLSTVTTTFLDAFSAGVSCQSLVPKVSDKVLALIATVLGVILAIFAAPDQFQDFLYLIGSVFAPMTAILLSDFFILKQDHTADSVNWLNLVLWVLGVALYRFLLNVDTPVGITVPVVVILMVISALVHKVLNKA